MFQGGYVPQDIFCSQRIMPDTQSAFQGHPPSSHLSQKSIHLRQMRA